jgi:hypothetical protein
MTGADPLPWLLEAKNPSARYLALTSLLDLPADDPDVLAVRAAIPGWGPAKAILDAQWPQGYWISPGIGYSPKHKATAWQVIFLAAMGTPCIDAVEHACAYLLEHSRLPDGRFSARKTAKGAFACLNGNLLRAMLQLGYTDPRLVESMETLAETVIRDGFRCRYNAAGIDEGSPPAQMRDGLPCAWGAVKCLGAFAEIPLKRRSSMVAAAVESGIALLLAGDLPTGDYPTATEPSPIWQQFGFPLGYTSDLLEALEVLGKLGLGGHPRLVTAVEVVHSKRDSSGRWALEHTPGNTWGSFGKLGTPNKWVTLRALRVLRHWE